jgi:pimeloyl-ACP methyl ester carboxylesterase
MPGQPELSPQHRCRVPGSDDYNVHYYLCAFKKLTDGCKLNRLAAAPKNLIMPLAQKLAIRYIRTKFALLSAVSRRKAARAAFTLFCTPQYRNKKKLPPVFESAEKLQLLFDGLPVRGYRWNHPAEKKVLILHGFESSVVNFDRYIKPLIKKGYEVLAFDAPAHGRSAGKRINVLQYKRLIEQINLEYGPITSYIAHSLGGLTVSLYLESIPHNKDYRLVLIAPAMETRTAIDNFFSFLLLDEGVRVHFDRLIEKLGGQPPSWYSVRRAAASIRAQVLFFQDLDDEMTPLRDVEPLMHMNYPNFQFVISEGLGHRRIYRDNRTFKAVMDFL